jgi:uncharacterized protein YhfF
MTPLPPEYEAFWHAAETACPGLDRTRFYEAFAFGDSEAMADELAALVLVGRKRATASLVWTFEHEQRPPPRPGDLSIVTSWARQPLCLIETTAVEVVAFEDVGEDFARTEGEGEATLASWRRDHSTFFAGECRRIGRTPDPRMPVVCERFNVVYQPAARSAARP